MKALVTGGAGFIGSHIAEELCNRGAKVVLLDDLSSGSLQNLAWKKNSQDIELVQAPLADNATIRKIITGCDWVFHQAAVASVPLSVKQPLETHRDNLSATLELLIAARDARVNRFVFASSSAIYGDSNAPVKQESAPVSPLSPYALQKYSAEKYAQMFYQFYGLETVSLRYFNVFGPRQSFDSPYSGVIARFCTAILQNQAPVVFGDGLQSRDFIYIKNVVSANLLAAEALAEKAAGKFFNIGGGESITLLQLIQELNSLTGKNLLPEFQPARPGDVRSSQASIEAAQTNLGYKVTTPWQTGLAQTLEFYRR